MQGRFQKTLIVDASFTFFLTRLINISPHRGFFLALNDAEKVALRLRPRVRYIRYAHVCGGHVAR